MHKNYHVFEQHESYCSVWLVQGLRNEGDLLENNSHVNQVLACCRMKEIG